MRKARREEEEERKRRQKEKQERRGEERDAGLRRERGTILCKGTDFFKLSQETANLFFDYSSFSILTSTVLMINHYIHYITSTASPNFPQLSLQ